MWPVTPTAPILPRGDRGANVVGFRPGPCEIYTAA
jgi:hypothetical protein